MPFADSKLYFGFGQIIFQVTRLPFPYPASNKQKGHLSQQASLKLPAHIRKISPGSAFCCAFWYGQSSKIAERRKLSRQFRSFVGTDFEIVAIVAQRSAL
jgi:hypothetical protein